MLPSQKFLTSMLLLAILFLRSSTATANPSDLYRLQQAYSEHIHSTSDQSITWADGTQMPFQATKPNKTEQEKLDTPALLDQIHNVSYPSALLSATPLTDPGRIRYEPFFRKMYGDSAAEVEAHLTTIYWMPTYFEQRYPLQVTTVNGIDRKLRHISAELEKLVAEHPDYLVFLDHPGGTFSWRVIANTNRLSLHSFGMTIDINEDLSNYWQWDLEEENRPITETEKLTYQNSIPLEIVAIFEKYHFIWGGKWQHYDTMHFEYRPELFL